MPHIQIDLVLKYTSLLLLVIKLHDKLKVLKVNDIIHLLDKKHYINYTFGCGRERKKKLCSHLC